MKNIASLRVSRQPKDNTAMPTPNSRPANGARPPFPIKVPPIKTHATHPNQRPGGCISKELLDKSDTRRLGVRQFEERIASELLRKNVIATSSEPLVREVAHQLYDTLQHLDPLDQVGLVAQVVGMLYKVSGSITNFANQPHDVNLVLAGKKDPNEKPLDFFILQNLRK